jgi:hypothetical protein
MPKRFHLFVIVNPAFKKTYLESGLKALFSTSITNLCGKAYDLFPLIPSIVSAATMALLIASSVACIIVSKSGLISSLESVSTFVKLDRRKADGLER